MKHIYVNRRNIDTNAAALQAGAQPTETVLTVALFPAEGEEPRYVHGSSLAIDGPCIVVYQPQARDPTGGPPMLWIETEAPIELDGETYH